MKKDGIGTDNVRGGGGPRSDDDWARLDYIKETWS